MSHGMHPDRCDSCGGYHFNGEPGLCDQCTAGRRRIAVAALLLAGERECLGCGAGVFWMAGQSPALWCQRCRPSAEEAYEAGRIEGAERALLERDVAEVAYHAERCDDALREVNEDMAEGYDLSVEESESERWLRRQLDTMLLWLARAKAVLG